MENVVIMTEGRSPYGNYVRFNLKGTRAVLGRIVKYGNNWAIYDGDGRYLDEKKTKTGALAFLQKHLGQENKFRWNIMVEKISFA